MLWANDKEQVHKWSQRQLGTGCRLASIYEKEMADVDDWIEKGGTGIYHDDTDGCSPLMSVTSVYSSALKNNQDVSRENELNHTTNFFQFSGHTVH